MLRDDLFDVDEQTFPLNFALEERLFNVEEVDANLLFAQHGFPVHQQPDVEQRERMVKFYQAALFSIQQEAFDFFLQTLQSCQRANHAYTQIKQKSKQDDCYFLRIMVCYQEFAFKLLSKPEKSSFQGGPLMITGAIVELSKKHENDDEIYSLLAQYFFYLNQNIIYICFHNLLNGDFNHAMDILSYVNHLLLLFPDKYFANCSTLDGQEVRSLQWRYPIKVPMANNENVISFIRQYASRLASGHATLQPGQLDKFNLYTAMLLVFGGFDEEPKEVVSAMIDIALSNLKNPIKMADRDLKNALTLFDTAMQKAFTLAKDDSLKGKKVISEGARAIFSKFESYADLKGMKPAAVNPSAPPSPEPSTIVKVSNKFFSDSDRKRGAETLGEEASLGTQKKH